MLQGRNKKIESWSRPDVCELGWILEKRMSRKFTGYLLDRLHFYLFIFILNLCTKIIINYVSPAVIYFAAVSVSERASAVS